MQGFTIHYKYEKLPTLLDWIDLREKYERSSSNKIEDVFSFLDLCFEKNISRYSGWIIEEDDKLKKIAASLYKRGVSYRVDGSDGGIIYNKNYEYLDTKPTTEVKFLSWDDIKEVIRNSDNYVVMDSNLKSLDLKFCDGRYVKVDERIKNEKYFLKYFNDIKNEFNGNPSFYKKHIVLIGGGVLSDMFGLICRLMNLSFSIVPTTLLSMVDASLGGKVGINHSRFGKNQIGSFYFPSHIYVCKEFLSTLKKEDIDNGFVESFKMAFLVKDFDLIKKLLEFRKNGKLLDSSTTEKLMKIKKSFIEEDPIEEGRRSYLNLGHTLAHVIEAVASANGKSISHGMAVNVGLRFCLYLSRELNLLSEDRYDFFIQVLDESRLNLELEKICECLGIKSFNKIDLINYLESNDELFRFFKLDKKNTYEDIEKESVIFILLNDKENYCKKSLDLFCVKEKFIEFIIQN